jgi:V/A-type H+-transporting ATPase subunit I
MPDGYEVKFGFFGMFDPLADPLTALIIALGIGALQILTGMAIKAYLLCRDGKPLDALMDVGGWWLTFAGIALLAAGKGPAVVICGAAALVLTQGRKKKGILGKLVGGLSSLYNITAYMSDVLSYSRLLALAMATSVIAMVFNILAGLAGGPTVLGAIIFILIFVAGHVFNMLVNIIGTYVHGARLQYLEYFKHWYEDGGPPFRPFTINTRYADIIKEEE